MKKRPTRIQQLDQERQPIRADAARRPDFRVQIKRYALAHKPNPQVEVWRTMSLLEAVTELFADTHADFYLRRRYQSILRGDTFVNLGDWELRPVVGSHATDEAMLCAA